MAPASNSTPSACIAALSAGAMSVMRLAILQGTVETRAEAEEVVVVDAGEVGQLPTDGSCSKRNWVSIGDVASSMTQGETLWVSSSGMPIAFSDKFAQPPFLQSRAASTSNVCVPAWALYSCHL